MAGTPHDLTELPGVGPKTAAALRAAGFHSLDDLEGVDAGDLVAVEGIGPTLAADIVARLGDPSGARSPDGDEVDASNDVGGAVADRGGPEAAAELTGEAPAIAPSLDSDGHGALDEPPLPAPLAELLAGASNALVLAEHSRGDDGCATLLAHQTTPEDGLVLISFVESADDRLAAVSQLPGDSRGVSLVCMGDYTRAASADTTTLPTPLGEATVTAIADATDLFRLGVHASRALEEANGRPALCLHSVSALIGLVDLQRVFRFLHVLSRRVQSVDGRAHYHLDPSAVDDRTYATLRPLFDVVVRLDGGRWSLE